MPSFRTCSRVVCGLIALAGAWLPSAARAQLASEFQPTFDSGARTVSGFQKQTQPVSSGPSRFGELPGGKTATVSDSTTTRGDGKKSTASAGSKTDGSDESEASAGTSAGTTGFDSSNARRKKAARKAKKGTPPPLAPADAAAARAIARGPQQLYSRSVVLPEAGAVPVTGTLPPVVIPVHRRPSAYIDPYAPIGIHAGSFLLFPAVELIGGYDSNPLRRPGGPGSGVFIAAPELKVQSLWTRHELRAEMRGSYLAYSRTFSDVAAASSTTTSGGSVVNSGIPNSLDRPDFEGKVNGRIDVHGRSHADVEGRFTVGTDNPGSPNIAAGLERLPIFTRLGGSLGYTQNFNRVDLTAKGGVDRIEYQRSSLTDGSTSSNDDRNYNQYNFSLRGAYELRPGVNLFAEGAADERVHDLVYDRNGINRDSDAVTARVGTTFELNRQLTGEISGGYTRREYKDPSLRELSGLVADASLVWIASGLTTVTFTARSGTDESVVADVSGVLRRDVALQVDHSFRQWLVGTVKGGMGFDTYEASGTSREDQRFFLAAALVYKLSREWQLKGEIRHDWLNSNAANVGYTADTFLMGLRWQH